MGHSVQGEADTCIDHVFSAAYGAAYGEHNFFVRTVEGADRSGIFTPVVTQAGCKGQFVIRVKFQRMEGAARAAAPARPSSCDCLPC